MEFERQKPELPYLGFLELCVSKPGLQAFLEETEAAIGIADPDLGGVALIPAFDFGYFCRFADRASRRR